MSLTRCPPEQRFKQVDYFAFLELGRLSEAAEDCDVFRSRPAARSKANFSKSHQRTQGPFRMVLRRGSSKANEGENFLRGRLKNTRFLNFNLYYFTHVLEKLGMASYPSSMTDSEWEILEPLVPPKPDTLRGRPQEHSRRSIVDGILYIIRTGGKWGHKWGQVTHFSINSLFPRLRSGHRLFQRPSLQKQIPSNQ